MIQPVPDSAVDNFQRISRRDFLSATALALVAAAGSFPFAPWPGIASGSAPVLPVGSAPEPLEAAWFPSRLHAFVWRNWSLVPPTLLASVAGAKSEDMTNLGRSMGLEPARGLSPSLRRRAAITIIRRNWHLLPYDQLLSLLGWTPEEMAFTLREDDFLFEKLGGLKPNCPPLRWVEPTAAEAARAREISRVVRKRFPKGRLEGREPLFSFIENLGKPVPSERRPIPGAASAPLRLGYSYYALYGDPLIDASLDPYPDGYLARVAAAGVNAVWLQGVLSRLSPVPWSDDDKIEHRRAALRDLAARAARHGVKVFLYLNEPRSQPTSSGLFDKNPGWRGVDENGYAALCTSSAGVRDALREAVADLCRAVPGLGGFFTITASENFTNCWSHGGGARCPRCQARRPAEVMAEVNAIFHEGIRAANGGQRLLAWDWGWGDDWAVDAIGRLPTGVELMSVSEWGLPIERGGVKSVVGEYSLSSIGPGPRALRHWAAARQRGLGVVAKIQCANSWELSAVPYLPVVENVALHAAALREAGVESMMLGWTLGGHPSPNLAAIVEIGSGGTLETLARRLYGDGQAQAAAAFWRECSGAFRQFPFNVGCVYFAPLQMGPAAPLWPAPTGYKACMVGTPYDDVEAWRGIYPAEVFAGQLEIVAAGFEAAAAKLSAAIPSPSSALAEELTFVEAAAIHFASVANQCRYVLVRRAGDAAVKVRFIEAEAVLAARLHALQSRDARLGFEASNQYYYIPLDLVEKVINCGWLASSLRGPKAPSLPLLQTAPSP
jgi:hypothetical protein